MRDKADEVEARVAVDCSTFDRVLMYLEASARGQARIQQPTHPASAFGPATTPALSLTSGPTCGRATPPQLLGPPPPPPLILLNSSLTGDPYLWARRPQGDAFTFDANSLEDVAEAARALGCRPLVERTAQARACTTLIAQP